MAATEIIFEVREDEVDGGFNAQALGHDIFTQADSLGELWTMVKNAVGCHFGDGASTHFRVVSKLDSSAV